MDIKNRDCQYFCNGFWQPCKLINFHNLEHIGIIYTIEFQGNLLNVPYKNLRFINNSNHPLFTPLQSKPDDEVFFH